MKLIKLIIRWWVKLVTQVRIIIAAAELCIEDEGEALRYHPLCGTTMRLGHSRVMNGPVRWCYKCRDFWPDRDDDEGGRGKKTPPPPPTFDPTIPGLQEGDGWKESAQVLRRHLKKPTVTER